MGLCKRTPRVGKALFVSGDPLLDLAQPKHVCERAAPRRQVRVCTRHEVPKAQRERLPAKRDRAQVFLEPCALATVPRRLGQHDPLPHDQVALGLLHAFY
jgi:hypothetical protein